MPQWVTMSTPASIAMSKLSTEVVCVCTVNPARCPSSTITRCTAGENDTKFISTCPLAPYLRKFTPVLAYLRIALRTESGGSHSSARPVFCSQVSLTRDANVLLTCDAASSRKSAESGPSKPMMFPAR